MKEWFGFFTGLFGLTESVYFVEGHSSPSEFFATDQTRDQFVQAMV